MRITFFTLLFALLFCLKGQSQNCLPNGITFFTQAEIDNFPVNYPGCTMIEGDVSIIGSGITNLNGLSGITSIGGALSIFDNNGLTNLNGLENITSVGWNLYVSNNSGLTSLDGLDNITSVGGGLWVTNNSMLTSLGGLEKITTVIGLFITNNAALTNLTGLGVITADSAMSISSNPLLTNLSGLESLVEVRGGLRISNNNALTSLNGLENLTSVYGLYINGNATLTSLNGLNNLASTSWDVVISNNPELTSLSGLGNLNSVGQIEISNNAVLTNLNGLEQIKSLNILNISNNAALTSLNGLANLDTVGSYLDINNNDALTSLDGLEKLTAIGVTWPGEGQLNIFDNAALTNLNGLNQVATLANGSLGIHNNPLLSDCAIFIVCNLLFEGLGSVSVSNNAPGCNTPSEVEAQCDNTPVVVEVQTDNSGACSSGTPVPNLQVHLQGAIQMGIKPTDANGLAFFDYLESGPFTLVLPEVNDEHWSVTQFTQTLTASDGGDSIHVFLCLSPLNQCPELTATLGLPSNFRGCLVNSDVQVSAQNTGTVLAGGVQLAVVVPPVFELLSSVPPFSLQSGDTLFFELGDLKPFETAIVLLTVKTKCDTFLFGQTLCWETFATMDNPCPSTLPAHSEIKLSAACMGDTIVRFSLKNIGDAPTQGWHEYKIIRNDAVQYNNAFSLNAQQNLSFDFPADGATWRMEATKFDDGTQTAVALENCGGLTPGYITAFWLDEGPVEYDFDCRQVIGSYDPNRKTAVPTGTGWQGLIVANHTLQYTIDFQNTGTDTAFRVLLRDVLPSHLDLNTFRPGFSSHPCTWEISGNKLEVLFSPIALPDSNVNEPASHGFFSFDIDPKPNLPDGTFLENTASIIFDFNSPIVTNAVRHTIGKLTVRVDEAQQNETLWRVWGNPVRDAAIFRTEEFIAGEKRFELYDAAGLLVRTTQFSGQEFEFQRDFLPDGLYFFRIANEQRRVFAGKIVVVD